MIRKSAEMEQEFRERMRDGKGTVTIKHLFSQSEIRGKARLIAEVTLPSGASIGYHQHDREEEIFYILSGTGIINDDGKVQSINPGDAVITGGGSSHSIENSGSEPLVFLATIILFD